MQEETGKIKQSQESRTQQSKMLSQTPARVPRPQLDATLPRRHWPSSLRPPAHLHSSAKLRVSGPCGWWPDLPGIWGRKHLALWAWVSLLGFPETTGRQGRQKWQKPAWWLCEAVPEQPGLSLFSPCFPCYIEQFAKPGDLGSINCIYITYISFKVRLQPWDSHLKFLSLFMCTSKWTWTKLRNISR